MTRVPDPPHPAAGDVNGPTRRTLLERVRDPRDDEAWERFHAVYAPLILRWALLRGLGEADAEEVRDQCLIKIARRLPDFEYDPRKGRFKAWLHRIARDEVVDHLRRRRPQQADTHALGELQARDASPPEAWEEEWRRHHLRYGLEQAARRLPAKDYEAFRMLLLEDATVPEVCERMSWNANQVYKAKSRALRQVRKVLADLGIE